MENLKSNYNSNHEPRQCPRCHSVSLTYESDTKRTSEYILYCWTCDACGQAGREYYELTFIEHELT